MTIIAWDGKALVADGRVCQGHSIVTDKYYKIIIFKEPIKYFDDVLLVIALSGSINDVDRLLEHIRREDGGDDFPSNNFSHNITAIIIGKEYNYLLDDDKRSYLTRYDKACKLAEGSGGEVAMTAMHMGKNALEAARIACERVTTCGGHLVVWKPGKECCRTYTC